jgi:hypothetical protein
MAFGVPGRRKDTVSRRREVSCVEMSGVCGTQHCWQPAQVMIKMVWQATGL